MNAAPDAPSASLISLHEALAARVPAPRLKEAEKLAGVCFRRIPEDDFKARSVTDWAGLIIGLREFIRERKAGSPKLRIFNPSVEECGWESSHTVVQIVNDDMPFLVDSVGMALNTHDAIIHTLIHPTIEVDRDGSGCALSIGERGKEESIIHIEIDRVSEPSELRRIENSILKSLADVRVCVRDWQVIRDRMSSCVDELDTALLPISDADRLEAQAFLRWVVDDHFTFLGYREYTVGEEEGEGVLVSVPDTGLGLLSAASVTAGGRRLTTLAANYTPPPSAETLILTKTNSRSSVHRPGYMDYIGVLRFNAEGRPIGEHRFLGLYTSSAYNRRPWDIPLVRQRFEHVMAKSGLTAGGHSGKALRHILETLPRDELFQSTGDELAETALGILGLQERARTKLFLRQGRYGRFFSALVYIPRDRFNTDVRKRIESMLKEALHGERLDTNISVGESPLAQLHLLIRPHPEAEFTVDLPALEAAVASIVRNWQDDLRERLVEIHGEEKGLRLAARFGRSFPAGYTEKVKAASAAEDVEYLTRLRSDADLQIHLYRSDAGQLRVKLYRLGNDIVLSDALPMMENMGMRVLAEHPYELRSGDEILFIQDFEIELPAGVEVEVERIHSGFSEAFAAIWRGEAESDGFNRLLLLAGLGWRQIAVLRGYCKFLLQAKVPFSQPYMEDTLAGYPLLVRVLVEQFEAKFHPATGSESEAEIAEGQERHSHELLRLTAGNVQQQSTVERLVAARSGSRQQQIDAAESALGDLMDAVSSIDEDRIFRSFAKIIRATLRTSFYQLENDQHLSTISFKLDPSQVPDLPKPRPYREIFVYGPRVEGVHLRFGPVARGGLRWSDRREDFRTEVLGLVKAQMVKNTVIVPVGAKGGFFVKRPAVGDRDAVLAEGIACYRLFINGLLTITDNLVEGAVVHPENVVRHDQDDPYLVVAADKGTATFSDIANSISQERGFWMGDAFASGGSVGYDHKGMGITAKGAWESVKRHFRALGRDSQREDFTCVGIGDMSGDVFGNGMLLSEHIRLIAAFDHRHVFIDPTPSASVSFVERQRLFAVPRSSWEDYDSALISAGGGIWPRSAKSIPLSAEAKQALGIDPSVESMTPNELLSTILRARVDLLWNGGIGTYIKSSSETHADVGDRANNAIRVDGGELRCRIVGEGGNLGVTQLGRIEAAQHGVLLNTDFIDNSAGVDTSDHEVNIKILLNDAVAREEMTVEERNALLAQMTDEVEQLVLFDNYRQNQAISMMEQMSVSRLGSKQHFIRTLESKGLLDRALEYLPTDAELSERKRRGAGLTRPELSILLSYSKIVAYQELLDSDVPEDPYLSKELARYFPEPLRERFGEHMQRHRLRREIIATAVTNSMVNRMGSTFVMRLQEDTGATPAAVAKAYSIAREIIDARWAWGEIDALDGQVAESAQVNALMRIWSLLRQMTRWILQRPGAQRDIAAAVSRYQPGIESLGEGLCNVLARDERNEYKDDRSRWLDLGFSDALAERLALLARLPLALDMIEVSHQLSLPVLDVARVFSEIGQALHLGWLGNRIEALPVEGRWHALARGVLRDELHAQQSALATQLLSDGELPIEQRVSTWMQRDDPSLRFTLQMFDEIRNQRSADYPTVSVALRRLTQLAAFASD